MAGVLVIGSSNTDLVCRSPRIPAPGETITGRSFDTYPGGKGANQAVAAARAGAVVRFAGARGDDAFGEARHSDLAAEGINVDLLRVVPGESSGVALIVVDDEGENQIVYVPGANGLINNDDAAAGLSDPALSVVSLTFETPFDVVAFAVHHRPEAMQVILNAAPFDERLSDLLPHLDVVICNEVEASALLGRPVLNETAMEDAREIVLRGARAVVLTLGGYGAVAAAGGDAWHTPAPTVEPVDTTGAGDAFCGALAAWLADGASLRDAVRAAVAAGSLSVTVAGAQPSLPRREQIEAMLNASIDG